MAGRRPSPLRICPPLSDLPFNSFLLRMDSNNLCLLANGFEGGVLSPAWHFLAGEITLSGPDGHPKPLRDCCRCFPLEL